MYIALEAKHHAGGLHSGAVTPVGEEDLASDRSADARDIVDREGGSLLALKSDAVHVHFEVLRSVQLSPVRDNSSAWIREFYCLGHCVSQYSGELDLSLREVVWQSLEQLHSQEYHIASTAVREVTRVHTH